MKEIENKPDGAILQRDGKTWAIVPRTPVGLVTADILEAIARTIRKYDIPVAKITSGQRVALVGLTEEQLDGAWAELGTDIGRATELCLHYVQACPGTAVCKLGLRDSLGLGLELEQAFMGMELPAKVKIGVSGCPMCCGESKVRDVGFIGKKDGWEMYVGGSAAGRPRIADELATGLSHEDAVALCRKFLEYYAANSSTRLRTAKFMKRHPIDEIKAALL